MASNDNKELEKLNRSMKDLLTAFEKMGKTLAESTNAILKAVKVMEEENRRKKDQMWYKQLPPSSDHSGMTTPNYGMVEVERIPFHTIGDQKTHNIDIHTMYGCDMANPETKDYHTEIYKDPLTMCIIQKVLCDDKIVQVTKIEPNGDFYDVTDEYVDKEDDQ